MCTEKRYIDRQNKNISGCFIRMRIFFVDFFIFAQTREGVSGLDGVFGVSHCDDDGDVFCKSDWLLGL
jgi:hypothetical protein